MRHSRRGRVERRITAKPAPADTLCQRPADDPVDPADRGRRVGTFRAARPRGGGGRSGRGLPQSPGRPGAPESRQDWLVKEPLRDRNRLGREARGDVRRPLSSRGPPPSPRRPSGATAVDFTGEVRERPGRLALAASEGPLHVALAPGLRVAASMDSQLPAVRAQRWRIDPGITSLPGTTGGSGG